MNLHNFRFETGADGVALATWDMPERSMNVITPDVMDELEQLIDTVVAAPDVKGCVIASGKSAFSGGADLSMLQHGAAQYARALKEQGEDAANKHFFEFSRRLSLLYRKLETCGKPFAVAIHGVCLGGAFELALACHYRVMADDEKTKVGLPEIKVGLFRAPAARSACHASCRPATRCNSCSGAIRSSRRAALGAKLVHEIAPKSEIVERARAFIVNGGKAQAPWDVKEFKTPSGRVFSPTGMMIWPAANAIYRRETYDNYPAAKAILHAVYEGLQLPMDQALTVEIALVRAYPALEGSGGDDPLAVSLEE